MAQFIEGSELNSKIEKIIREADKFLYLVCPYFKLHKRIKAELKAKMADKQLEVVVVYGKNEDNPAKSLSDEDADFLTGFRNIRIYYDADLHAKFYCSEDAALITSMNLHEYSQNNNTEVGVLLISDASNSSLRDLKGTPDTEAYNDALSYFKALMKRETPEFSSTNLNYTKEPYQPYPKPKQETGYCIRTGVPIPFDPSKPMCFQAFQTWLEYHNPDYPERYCHRTGWKSNGKTSMRQPILWDR
jgi:phosphatidylserine/phosphatidylglycerophosphate/cardiolipin synthase-like enzyme